MARRLSWPKIVFSNSGNKISAEVLRVLDPVRSTEYFEFLQKWNGGTPVGNCFKTHDARGNVTLGEVTRFFGVTDGCSESDLRIALYQFWDNLPRGALPIAEVNIGEDESDFRLLITFRWGQFHNQLFLLTHPHAGGTGKPDNLKSLQKVADSLPEFLSGLDAREHLHFRAWYKLPVMEHDLPQLATKMIKSGMVDPFQQFATISARKKGLAYHPKIGCGVWLAHGSEPIDDTVAPKSVPSGHSVLAIDAYRWDHAAAEQHVKRVLKSAKIEKLTKIGETPIARAVTG